MFESCSSTWLLIQVVRLALQGSDAVFQTQGSSDRLHNIVFRFKIHSRPMQHRDADWTLLKHAAWFVHAI